MPKARRVRPLVHFDTTRLCEDMAVQGLNQRMLARRAQCSDMSVHRFLAGERQTFPMIKKLAMALGHSVERYLHRRGNRHE